MKRTERSLQILSKHCINDDFDVMPERPVIQILYVYPYLVGKQYLVIILLRILLFCQQFFLIPIFQACRKASSTPSKHKSLITTAKVAFLWLGARRHLGTLTARQVETFAHTAIYKKGSLTPKTKDREIEDKEKELKISLWKRGEL